LFVAFELRENTWKLGFTLGQGHNPRERTMVARAPQRLLDEVAQAKARWGLGATAPVVSCDAAGREGFWLHRFLQAHGITNQVGEASSIAVNRRKRRAKSDAVDVRKLLRMVRRSHHGARQGWRVVQGPSVAAEDQRPVHRELEPLKQDRARTTNRSKGWLRSQGVRLTSVPQLPQPRDGLRRWDGSPLPRGLPRRLLRVYAHDTLLSEQRAGLEAERRALWRSWQEANREKGRQWMQLQGLGINGAWLLGREFFGWRDWKNRHEVGGFAG
jgi:transposase